MNYSKRIFFAGNLQRTSQINSNFIRTFNSRLSKHFSSGSILNEYKFTSSSCMIPHPKKAKKGGEDACFETEDALGVADGVGGWESVGVDPGLYSRALMESCKITSISIKDPVKILSKACEDAKIFTGTSTAVIVLLKEDKLLTANLGDSGFFIIRNQKMIYKSTPLQHSFNAPFQVGTNGDPPEASHVETIKIQEGDLVTLATDGFFDNVFEKDYLPLFIDNSNPATLAKTLAELAFQKSQGKGPTPFYIESGKLWKTKPDDITVVVGLIQKKLSEIPKAKL